MAQRQVEIRVREAVETARVEEFHQWLEHPVTEQLFRYLEKKRDELKEAWATGAFAAPTIEEMAIRNAAAQGAASVLEEVLTLDVTSFSEEE